MRIEYCGMDKEHDVKYRYAIIYEFGERKMPMLWEVEKELIKMGYKTSSFCSDTGDFQDGTIYIVVEDKDEYNDVKADYKRAKKIVRKNMKERKREEK